MCGHPGTWTRCPHLSLSLDSNTRSVTVTPGCSDTWGPHLREGSSTEVVHLNQTLTCLLALVETTLVVPSFTTSLQGSLLTMRRQKANSHMVEFSPQLQRSQVKAGTLSKQTLWVSSTSMWSMVTRVLCIDKLDFEKWDSWNTIYELQKWLYSQRKHRVWQDFAFHKDRIAYYGMWGMEGLQDTGRSSKIVSICKIFPQHSFLTGHSLSFMIYILTWSFSSIGWPPLAMSLSLPVSCWTEGVCHQKEPNSPSLTSFLSINMKVRLKEEPKGICLELNAKYISVY